MSSIKHFVTFFHLYVFNQSFWICLENYHNCCGRHRSIVVGIVVATDSIYRNYYVHVCVCMCLCLIIYMSVYVYLSLSLCMRMMIYIFHMCGSTYNCERLFYISTRFASKTVYSLSNRIIISISIFNMHSVISNSAYFSLLLCHSNWSKTRFE